MFSTNSLGMIDIVVQVVCLLRAEWILLTYVLGRMVYSFRERIYNSENILIKCIVNSTAWKGFDLLSIWNSTLYNMILLSWCERVRAKMTLIASETDSKLFAYF